jgi:hypothetical protein
MSPEPNSATSRRTAIVYDFDGTLAPGNIQEHSFLPDHDVDKAVFWNKVRSLSEEHDADQILVYMREMLLLAKEKGVPITRDRLRRYGAGLELYPGVESWWECKNVSVNWKSATSLKEPPLG